MFLFLYYEVGEPRILNKDTTQTTRPHGINRVHDGWLACPFQREIYWHSMNWRLNHSFFSVGAAMSPTSFFMTSEKQFSRPESIVEGKIDGVLRKLYFCTVLTTGVRKIKDSLRDRTCL